MKSFQSIAISILVVSLVWAGRPITAEDIVGLKTIAQPAVDPSGKYVAYVKIIPRGKDDDRGGSYREIWVTTVEGSEQRQFTNAPINSWFPQWTPEGSISFLSKRKGHHASTQVYILPIDGGEAKLLTSHHTDIGTYAWSADGKWIAFLSQDEETKERKRAKEEGRDMIVMDKHHRYTRLWLYNVKTGSYQKIFKKNLNVVNFKWSPDSKTVVFQATDKTGADRDLMQRSIYRVRVPGGKPKKVVKTLGKLGDIAISPNSDFIAFLGATSLNDPLPQSVFIVPINGGQAKLITREFKESFNSLEWIDNENILGKSTRGTKTVLSQLEITQSSPEGIANQSEILLPQEILGSLSYHFSSNSFILTASSQHHPNELFVGSLNTKGIKRLTYSNPILENIDLAQQETISWTGPDGLQIEGILTYPLKYRKGKKYPLLLQIHGGPEGVSLDGWTTWTTYPVQLLAAEGYVVLQPNYRGSGGRGVSFSKADHDDLAGLEFEDILAGVDELISRGLVHKDKVGTGGWSYGGYCSAWAATKYSERFKASMVGAGISNWISFTGTTDIPYEMSIVHWNQWWFDNMDLHWERSPLAHINKAQTPTLVVHGLKDERVHPEQGMELWQALKIKGVDTELVLYPREPHGLTERAHKLDYLNRLVNWYNQYVK